VNKIRSDATCIGVDVIVGFPGETDEHFLETYHFFE
jgi:threonylcarbamoyladenosine tRNA methylthiotransferase MtaB